MVTTGPARGRLQRLRAAGTEIEYLVTGSGQPVTVFAHGLASSIDQTRPFGSGVRGSRVFLHFRGHGGSGEPSTPWTYDAVADEVAAVADRVGATRALGVSLGAGATLRLAVREPGRFERLVLALPAAIDRARDDVTVTRFRRMADRLATGDLEEVAELLVLEQPAGARDRPDVHVWARQRARRLARSSVLRGLRELPPQHPLDDAAALSRLTTPVLVIGQRGDDTHPAAVAEELAERLPRARLEMFDAGGVLWGHRQELRALIGGFLNADSGRTR